MNPSFSMDNSQNGLRSYSKTLGKTTTSKFSIFMERSNFKNLIFRKLGGPSFRSSWSAFWMSVSSVANPCSKSAFGFSIKNIDKIASKKKMIGIAALRIIAPMTNQIVKRIYFTIVEKSQSMGLCCKRTAEKINEHLSVCSIRRSVPFPAIIIFSNINFGPESFFNFRFAKPNR